MPTGCPPRKSSSTTLSATCAGQPSSSRPTDSRTQSGSRFLTFTASYPYTGSSGLIPCVRGSSRPVAPQPVFQQLEVFGMGSRVGERYLVRAECALDLQPIDHLGSGPALR